MPPVITKKGLTNEQYANIENAQRSVLQGGLTPNVNVPTITPASLNPQTAVTPVVAPQTQITTPYFDLTPQEQGAEQGVRSGISDIQSLLGGLSDEETFRTQKESSQDIIGKKSALTSLGNQLKNLQQQAQGISLQEAEELRKMRESAAGQGITTGTLGSQQAGVSSRYNDIRLSNAIQQYSVGAQYYAAQGDYNTAISYVDEAVKLKYQPIKDRLATAQANLDLLLESPDLTNAQAKRAEARKAALDEETRRVVREEKDFETIQGLALQAAQNGAPTAIVNKLANSKTFQEALSYGAGYLQKETEGSIQRYNKAKQTGYTGSFADFIQFEEKVKLLGKATVVSPTSGTFETDLDALISNTMNLIPSKNGKEAFNASIKGARNDSDRFNSVATVVLKNSPGEVRNDFIKQRQGISDIEKAIRLIDEGVKTGLLQAGAQYTYNLLGNDFDPKLARINGLITSSIQPYRSSITGAAWGEQEDVEYQNLFGSTKYNPEALKNRLENVKEILLRKSVNALNSQVAPLGGSPFNDGSEEIIVAPDGEEIIIID